MSDDLKWALGLGLPIVVILIGAAWKLLALRIDAFEKAIWDQVGRSSKDGMREVVHRTAGESHGHGLEISDIKRRVGDVERKVFNGSGGR